MIYIDRKSIPMPHFFSSAMYEKMEIDLQAQFDVPEETQKKTRWRIDYRKLRSNLTDPLFDLFNGKCAYCEQKLTKKDSKVINHFRPVSLYPWLAYSWENLYLSCSRCSESKGQKFPLADEDSRALLGDRDLKKEKPYLIDPCVDQPEYHLEFDGKGTISSSSAFFNKFNRGGATIDVFGLNNYRLIDLRSKEAQRFKIFWTRAGDSTDAVDILLELVLEYIRSDKQFIAMKRQMLARLTISQLTRGDIEGLIYRVAQRLSGRLQLEITIENKIRNGNMDDVSRMLETCPDDVNWLDDQRNRPIVQLVDTKGDGIVKIEELIKNVSIESISISNFKAIHSLTIEPTIEFSEAVLESEEEESSIKEFKEWITLLGENGSGKSSILQAITLALAGEQYLVDPELKPFLRPERFLMRGKRVGEVRLALSSGDIIVLKITKTKFSFESGGENHGIFVRSYGSTRLLPIDSKASNLSSKENNIEIINMFDPFTPLIDAGNWLSLLSEEEFRPARLAIKDLIGLKDEQSVEKDGSTILVDGQPLENLSAGYQTIVALACDIMAGVPGNVKDMQFVQGIVLIDELETHLHPRWKMRIVSRLRKAFPQMQFFTSTHDPLCLRGLRKGEVLVVKREPDSTLPLAEQYEADQIVRIENELPSPKKLRVDQLLTSNHFGLESTIDPDVDRKFTEYYQLLARRDNLTSDENVRRNTLSSELHKYGVLGYTRRDQLIYEAIDDFLADQKTIETENQDEDDDRNKRREEVKKRVVDLWRYASIIDQEEGE
ncbi:MAG: TIGR02646 family protein [Verrucomicrobiota bacterium]